MLKIIDYPVGGPLCIISATVLQFSSLPPEIQKKSVAMVGDAHTNAPVYSKVPDGIAGQPSDEGARNRACKQFSSCAINPLRSEISITGFDIQNAHQNIYVQ